MMKAGRSTARRLIRRGHGDEEGQAAFEFLLILPAFFLFFLLMIDLGLLMYEHVSVSNAVREGARYGATNCGGNPCDDSIVALRTAERSGGIVSDAGEVTVGWVDNTGDGNNSGRGDSVVVRVLHPYDFLFFPFTMNVTSCSDMRLEQGDLGSGLPSGSAC